MSYSEWLESKENALEDARYEALEVAHRRRSSKGSRREESAAKYQAWLQHKDNYERAVTLLNRLHVDRCKVDDKWQEVAVALNAIDCLRGVYKAEGYQDLPVDRSPAHDAMKEEMAKRRTLEAEFYRWSRRPTIGHEFRDVEIPHGKVRQFSAAARNMMSEYAEDALQRKDAYVQASLKYTVPKVVQKAHDKRNLFNPDTTKFNAIFNRMARAEYAAAREEMYRRLDKECTKVELGPEDDLVAIQRKVLHRLGLGRLAKWVEEDALLEEQEQREKVQEERENAENMHRMFVAKKDRLRVRLPTNAGKATSGSSSSGRMNFSLGPDKTYRSNSQHSAPKGTLEIVRAAGLGGKYTYCSSERDLELAREALRKQGHVLKENFKDEDGDALLEEFYQAKEEAASAKAREMEETERRRKRQAEAQYDAWFDQKERRECAEKLLRSIEQPGKRGKGVSEDDSHWRQVAEQLKAVDIGLLPQFVDWSKGFRSPSRCAVLWESLPPTICDTCCVSSYVHKTLLKFLNRQGVNFKSIFDAQVDRHLARQMRNDGRELSEATVEERKEVEASLALSPKGFISMMKDAGIAVNRQEARILTTLFDENGDGKISRKEFLRFTGVRDRPHTRGESLFYLRTGKFCIWEACCHVTGLINAFEVLPTSEDESKEEEEDLLQKKNTKPLLLRNGRTKQGWIRLSLPDYIRRKQKLISMGEKTADDFDTAPPRSCQFSTWTEKRRDEALDSLRTNPALNASTILMSQAVKQGSVPAPPKIRLSDCQAIGEARQHELWLEWDVATDVSFFVVESCLEGRKTYEEVHRDPSTAGGDSARPNGKWKYTGLVPGQKVNLRIRAFNGHGPSAFAYGSYVTAPAQPSRPFPSRISAREVTINFDPDEVGLPASPEDVLVELTKAFDELKQENGLVKVQDMIDLLFQADQTSVSGRSLRAASEILRNEWPPFVSREDLEQVVVSLPQRRTGNAASNKAKKTSDKKAGEEVYVLCKCVSDEEVDFRDYAGRSLEEVSMEVLRASHWHAERCTLQLPTPQLVEAPVLSAHANEKPSLRVVIPLSTRKSSSTWTLPTQRIGIVQEPIVHLEVFEQVYVGAEPQCTLGSLVPGEAYQFRVLHMRKADNQICSRMSEPLVVHVPLRRPSAPIVVNGKISTDGARVRWELTPSAEKERSWEGVVKSWTADLTSGVGGVNDSTVRKIFLRYDVDGNGMIEGAEVEKLLDDIGVGTSKSSREYALATLDRSGDGKISYKEFAQWLSSQLRSAVLLHKVKGRDKRWETVYRGEETEVDVAGLEANTVHCFAVRLETHRVSSTISPMLELMTAPEIPQQPIAVQVGKKQCWVKWYAGHGGAERYALEMVQVEHLDGGKGAGRRSASGWTEEYNGKRNVCLVEGLEPNTVYRMRVRAINVKGLSSQPSLPSQIVTMGGDESLEMIQNKANAPSYFEIECTGDVVVGDTILFSERVFRKARGQGSQSVHNTSSTLSQQSISSLGRLKSSAEEFVCERTVAAQVLNQKTYLDRPRDIICQVLWCTLSSKDAPKTYSLIPGSRITRSEKEMFKFETFRARWTQEDQRWSYNEEREANLVMLSK